MVHLVREIYHHNYSWKDIQLSELGELYIAMMIKTLGLSLIGIFVPIYLYQLGYSLEDISLFYVVTYSIRSLTDNIVAKIVGYFGPKHVMILSHMFLIITLGLLLSLGTTVWPLPLIALTNAIAGGMFFTAYHIEFSKIQSSRKAGQQIGKMYKLGKFASAVGPLLGGVLATIYNVQLVIVLAMILILASAIPLLLSPEPVRQRQHVTLKGFPWKAVKWDIISNMGLSVDQMTNLFIWPLYISIFIFTENVYLSVGVVTSLGLAVSFFVVTLYGRVIDKSRGNQLLKVGVVGSSIGHMLRLIIATPAAAYLFNLFSDPAAIAIRMPYTKGLYGAASSHEGYRDAYIGVVMTSSNIVRACVFILVYFISSVSSDKIALQTIFGLSIIAVWTATLHRYKALK